MSRSKNRISRSVFGVMIAVLVVGAFFWMRGSGTAGPVPVEAGPAQPSETARPDPGLEPGNVFKPISPGPMITSTPLPKTKPSLSDTTKRPDALSEKPIVPSRETSTADALPDARAMFQQGKLVEARSILSGALASGKLSDADATSVKTLLREINQKLIFSPERLPGDPYVGGYTVQGGDRLSKIAAKYDVSWELLCRINNISDPGKLRAGRTIKVIQGPFHAVVNKSAFSIDIYLGSPGERGSIYVTTFKVGLGKSDSTPTGTWMVSAGGKLKNPKFWGAADLPPIEADDPKNPLGERWIALEGTDGAAVGADGYGIHGTIEPDSIGKQASLGCIRLVNEEIELVFDLMAEGKSTVLVKP